MELAGGMRGELTCGFSSLHPVVASCSVNDIVATKCGVLGAIVALMFGCQFMVPIVVFNINKFWPLPYLCLCIITYIAFQFNQVNWCFLVTNIAYFCSY